MSALQRRAPIMLFVSLSVCDKSLRHETTTTLFRDSDYAACSFRPCFSPTDRRAKHDADAEKAGAKSTRAEKTNGIPLRTRRSALAEGASDSSAAGIRRH